MVEAKLRPITVRRRLPGFESLLFRSLILAAIFCLAASSGLNHPAGAAGAGACAGAWGYSGCGDHRIHFLGKGIMAGVPTSSREYPKPLFELRRVVGPKGRSSYENRQKLQVLEFSRLICSDGRPVGNRGAATVFGVDPKLLRNWGSQEAELKSSFEGDGSDHAGGGGARSLHPGRAASNKPKYVPGVNKEVENGILSSELAESNAAKSQPSTPASFVRGGATGAATGSDARNDPMTASEREGVVGVPPESRANGKGAKRKRQPPRTGAELERGSGVSSEGDAVGGKGTSAATAAVGGASVTVKREGYLVWDDYFMSVAFLSAMRSKDPSTQVGACIVNEDKRIVGIGYNGFPMGCSDDDLPWARQAERELDTKYPYVCHAEMNAILNKNSADVKGCKIYVALFPCNECAKLIIQSGIREVVYLSDKYRNTTSMKASRRLFGLAGVHCRQHVPKEDRIVIDFKSVLR